jgi:Transcription- and export-related complex subunit
MARLSADNYKEYGRHIGKMCHTNALIAFKIIIDRITRSPSLCDHFVDSSRTMSNLENDMLVYSILESLAKSTNKMEGVYATKEFNSLCELTGKFFVFVIDCRPRNLKLKSRGCLLISLANFRATLWVICWFCSSLLPE